MFYRILQPIVAKSKYKAFLLEFRGGQDGRRLWLKILSMEMSEGNRHQVVANLKKIFTKVYDGKSANLTFLTWYTDLKITYEAMWDNKEPTSSYTRIENTMKKMNLSENPTLQATIAALRVKHQGGDWDNFMQDCLLQVSQHELEANAGSAPFPRKVNQVSPDKRKHEADDDEGGEVEELLIDGIDCSEYVTRSGRLNVPDRVWSRSSGAFKYEVAKFNRAVDKHNTSVNKRARQKKHGDEDIDNDDDRGRDEDNAKDRKIKALMSRIEALEEEKKDEKGSNTGAGIAGRRGM